MSPGFRQRRYFRFPDWSSLDHATIVQAQAAQEEWQVCRAYGVGRPKAPKVESECTVAPVIAPHSLADVFASSAGLSGEISRHPVEAEALAHFRASWLQAMAEPDSSLFIALLEEIASLLVGSRQILRTGAIATNPDRRGLRVLFPRPDTLRARLGALHQFLRVAEGPPVFNSMVALVSVSNAHPFIDGNGRTARTLANLILNLDLDDPLHLPLRELGNRPPGNLTLYIRGAEMQGDWAALLGFLREAVQVWASSRFERVNC